MAETKNPSPANSQAAIKRLILWVVMLGIFGYLFAVVPVEAVWTALTRVSAPAYVALMVALIGASLLTDTFSYWVAIREVKREAAVGMRSVLEVRAASYLLSIVNYAVGQGSLVYLLRQNHRIAVLDGVSVVLLTTAANVLVVCALVGIGLMVGAVPGDPTIRLVVTAMLFGVPAYLLVVAIKPRILRRLPLVDPLLRVGVLGTLRITATRLLHVFVALVGHWLVLRLFDFQIPISEALVRMPLVFLTAALPITPAGLGTSQAVAVFLLADFASGAGAAERNAAVLGYSLSIYALGMVLQALLGLVFARKFVRERAETEPGV